MKIGAENRPRIHDHYYVCTSGGLGVSNLLEILSDTSVFVEPCSFWTYSLTKAEHHDHTRKHVTVWRELAVDEAPPRLRQA
jgi:hypothetical protein